MSIYWSFRKTNAETIYMAIKDMYIHVPRHYRSKAGGIVPWNMLMVLWEPMTDCDF